MKSLSESQKSLWQKTPYANLVRYVSSGAYYARIRIGGKLIRRSLKTDRISVANLRLSDLEKSERQTVMQEASVAGGKLAMTEAVALYQQRMQGDPSLKPCTKEYHQQRIQALFRSWPELERKELRALTKTDCLNWAARFSPQVSATAFNHTIGILRRILEIGMEVGARYDNPARFIKRMSERAKKLRPPEADQFEPFVNAITTAGGRFSSDCADLVRFLAFGGFRKHEASFITWADCDFSKGKIVVRGDPAQ